MLVEGSALSPCSFLKNRPWLGTGRVLRVLPAALPCPGHCRRTKRFNLNFRGLFGLRFRSAPLKNNNPFSSCVSPPVRCASHLPAPPSVTGHQGCPVPGVLLAAGCGGAGSQLGASGSPRALLIPILLKFLVNFSPGEVRDRGKPGWALFIVSRAIYRAARRNRGVYAHVFRGENGCICKSKSDLVQHSSS